MMRGLLLVCAALIVSACAEKPVVEAPRINPNWQNEVAAEHNHDVLLCYEALKTKKPKVAGEFTAVFRVAPDGTTNSGRFTQTLDPEFDECVLLAMSQWKFPWHADRGTSQTLYMTNTFTLTRDANGVGHSAFKEESSLDPEAVAVAVKTYEKESMACFKQALKRSPKLKGKLVMAWTIDSEGKGSDFNVKKSLEPKLDTCIMDSMKKWKYPQAPAGKRASVSHPFFFSNVEVQ